MIDSPYVFVSHIAALNTSLEPRKQNATTLYAILCCFAYKIILRMSSLVFPCVDSNNYPKSFGKIDHVFLIKKKIGLRADMTVFRGTHIAAGHCLVPNS